MNFGAFLGAAAQALEGATKQPQAHGHGNSSQGGAAGGMGMLGELLPMLQGGYDDPSTLSKEETEHDVMPKGGSDSYLRLADMFATCLWQRIVQASGPWRRRR